MARGVDAVLVVGAGAVEREHVGLVDTPSSVKVLTSATRPCSQSVLPALTAARHVIRSAPRL